MVTTSTLDVTAANGVPFRVVFLPDGQSVNFPTAGSWKGAKDTRPSVEFYDRRYPHTPDGQFTGGRYYADTILGHDSYSRSTGGVALQGGVPDWSVDADTMAIVRQWLTALVTA